MLMESPMRTPTKAMSFGQFLSLGRRPSTNDWHFSRELSMLTGEKTFTIPAQGEVAVISWHMGQCGN